MSTPRSRRQHSHQAAFREVSRSGPMSASRPLAASPLLDRPSHFYCRSSRQAPAPQRCCTQPGLSAKLSRNNIASWSQSTTSKEHTHRGWVSLWTKQHQQLSAGHPLTSLARVLESGTSCIASEYVGDRPSSSESRPSRIVGLSPASRSPFGTKLRWLGPFLLARVPSHFPQFCI